MIGRSGRKAKFGVRDLIHMYPSYRPDPPIVECPLPPLSELLKNPKIKETDSFVICVQIHSPVGPFYPQQPSVAYVPRDLLDGLEASLDNSSKKQPTSIF